VYVILVVQKFNKDMLCDEMLIVVTRNESRYDAGLQRSGVILMMENTREPSRCYLGLERIVNCCFSRRNILLGLSHSHKELWVHKTGNVV